KAFHPFGLAICSNEKTKDFEFIFNCIQIGLKKINKDLLKPTALICDAADAIKNGFKNVFGNSYNQIMCWAHMKRNVENRISHINDKDIAKEILEDIEMLQLCNSTIIFQLASTLSSNIVSNWSIERDASSINVKLFVTEPTISLKLWTSSCRWATSTKDITCIPNDSSKQYYIPARDLQSITQVNLDKYENKNEQLLINSKNHLIFGNYLSKHVVGMATRLKYCKPPAAAKTVPIGEKRKRGRPTMVKPALPVQ
ncbi:unnamed protein product, partial [Rotaria magnacalcarata]